MRTLSFKGLVRWLIVSSQVVLTTKWLVDQNQRNQLGEDTVIFDGMMVSFSTVIFPYPDPGNS